MKEEVGLWIDHKKTVIVVGKGKEILTLKSNVEENFRGTGGAKGRTPFGAKVFVTENQQDRRFTELLNKYYSDVIALLKGATSVVIMGPGEAKFELEKRLAHAGLKNNVLAIETADKLTDRQIAAKVKKYFASLRPQIQ